MKKTIFLALILLIGINLFSTETSLNNCLESLYENHPLSNNFEQQEKIYSKEKKLINKNWLPQLNLNASGSYQSEAAEMDINIPNMNLDIPEAPQEKYQISLDLQQTIFDGFANSNKKKLKKIESESKNLETKISLNELEEKVTKLYFNVILLDSKIEITRLGLENYTEKRELINSQIKNGLKIPADKLILSAEIKNLENKLENLRNSRTATIENLSELISQELSTTTKFKIPKIEVSLDNNFEKRPEKELFDSNRKNIKISKKLISSQYLPKIAAFSQYSYGKPGFDFFNDEMHDFYTFGVNFKWNLWDWQKKNDNHEILNASAKIIKYNEKTFDKRIKVELKSKLNEIKNLETKITKDKEIVQLRERILKSVNSQYENGTITSTEYVTNSNALLNAKEQLKIDEISLIKNKKEYKIIKGENYEN